MDQLLCDIFKGTGWTGNQRQLYQTFWNKTKPTKANSLKRLWRGKVFLDLKFDSPNHLSLEGIEAKTEMQGHGEKALDWLLELSNLYGVSICLHVYPYCKKANNPLFLADDLEAWYKRRGFVDNIFQTSGERPLIYRPR